MDTNAEWIKPSQEDELVRALTNKIPDAEKVFYENLLIAKLHTQALHQGNYMLTEAEVREVVRAFRRLVQQVRALQQQEKKHAKNWKDFWKEICLNEDGSVNLDQIKRELSDFHGMMKEVSEVYDTLTGGAISKPNTLASVVIAEVQRIQQEELDELEEELTGDAGQEGGQQG